MSSSQPEYEAIIYYKIGIAGSSKDAVASFVMRIDENTTISQFSEDLVDRLQKASVEVGAEFSENLLQYLFDEMTRNNDQDQTES